MTTPWLADLSHIDADLSHIDADLTWKWPATTGGQSADMRRWRGLRRHRRLVCGT